MTTTGSGEIRRTVLTFDARPPPEAKWLKVQTSDFTLYTDLDAALAQRAAQLLSQSLVGLGAMFARAPVLARDGLVIYAMRDSLDFERRFGKRTMGFTWRRVGGGQADAVICLYGPPDRWFEREAVNYDANQSVLQHELAHAVLRRYFPQQPAWFAEGMAQYLETFRWLDAETVQLGDPKLGAYRSYRAIRSLSVEDVIAWDGGQDGSELEVAGLYGLSWALVHYARNKEPRAFGLYLATLARSGPASAWDAAFADKAQSLDQDIYQYMKVGAYQAFTIKVALAPPVPAQVEAASDAEAHLVETGLDAMEAQLRHQRGRE